MEAYKIKIQNLNFFYGNFHALKNINLNIPSHGITALIGPSGCGKSTLLRCINRMNDTIENVRYEGKILIDNIDIINDKIELIELRKKVGMVFQRPNVLPLSIYENLAFGLKIHRMCKNKKEILARIEKYLKDVDLWDSLKDKLYTKATNLTLEQKQRLCIARVLILTPEIILLDEPCSTLDPIATLNIENLLTKLKERYTIIIVTHNMQQAARISSWCGFMLLGELIEFDKTEKIFTNPANKITENYITGVFG